MKILVPLLLFTCALVTQAQEHFSFRGSYLGQPLSDYVDCASGKAKSTRPDYKVHGKVCNGRGVVTRMKTNGSPHPRRAGEQFLFEDQKLVKILILLPKEEWDKVRYDLTQKLGEPLSELPQSYQHLLGAWWAFSQGFWQKDDLVAWAREDVWTTFGGCRGFVDVFDPVATSRPRPCSEGIEINITDLKHSTLPAARPSILD